MTNQDLYHKALHAWQAGTPIISDVEFDILERKIHPSIGIPGETKLPVRMWSIEKDQSCKLATKYRCIVQFKIDGVAILLKYRSGKFVDAFTRGDGLTGQCVTHHMQYVQFPKILSGHAAEKGTEVYIIGEAYITKETATKEGYKNARNGIAGLLNHKEEQPVDARNIKLFAFDIQYSDGPNPGSEIQKLQDLKKQGFLIPCTMASIKKAIKQVSELRDSYPYLIDGLVIKVDYQEDQLKLGYTDRHPKFYSAYKFAATANTTKVTKIEWQIGRTGVLVPVAHLEPLTLEGATITKATLHSYNTVASMGIKPNDIVTIKKAGDIIPYVSDVVEKGEYSYEVLIYDCPGCSKVVHIEGAHAMCKNYYCLEQRVQAFSYACKTIGVKGIGPKTAKDIVKETRDFSLRQSFERAKENGRARFPESVPMWKAIQMLGEAGIGKAAAKRLASGGISIKEYLTIDDAEALTQLLNIEK